MLNRLGSLDEALLRSVNHGWQSQALDPVFLFLSSWWTWGYVLLGLTLLVLFSRRKQWIKAWLFSLLCLGATDFISQFVLKSAFQRPRPCHELREIRLLTHCGSPYGLPSNHAANSMALAMALQLSLGSSWTVPFFVLAGLVGLSRVYLGVHFPFDVLLGFFVGGVVAFLLHRLFRYLVSLRR